MSNEIELALGGKVVKPTAEKESKATAVIDTPPVPAQKQVAKAPEVKPAEKQIEAVKAAHDFAVAYRGSAIQLRKNQIITDSQLIKYLLENKQPVVPVQQGIDFQYCPKCHHQF